MRRMLVLALLVLGCVLAGPAPAYACDQPARPFPAQLRDAGSVFTGTVTAVTPSSGDQVTYAVSVRRVFKGEVHVQTSVVSPAGVARCGLQGIERRRSYLFVSSQSGSELLVAGSHEGTRRLTPDLRDQVVGRLGAGTAPLPAPGADDEGATLTRVDTAGDPPEFLPLALPGLLLVVVGLLALMLARLVSRTGSRP
jgi:hypothetical protein